MAPVELTRWRGSAAEFHGRAIEGVTKTSVWHFEVTSAALALGSSQSWDAADAVACAAAGVDVVRRRSGGGAVLVEPDAIVWFDVVVPAVLLQRAGVGDDVGRSMVWLGDVVERALVELGVTGTAVHQGRMRRTTWSAARLRWARAG